MQKTLVADKTKEYDEKRKKGVKMIKARLSAIVDDEDFSLASKVERLNDEEALNAMIEKMK
jgi:hypothetical protein